MDAARTVGVVGAAAAAAAVPEAGWLGALSGATLEQLAELLKHDNAAVRGARPTPSLASATPEPLPLPTALPPKARRRRRPSIPSGSLPTNPFATPR